MKYWIVTLLFCFSTMTQAKGLLPSCWGIPGLKSGKIECIAKLLIKDNMLQGKIIKTIKIKGYPFLTYCHNCPGKFAKQRIIGIDFLWGGIKTKPNTWTKLHILDPKSGKIIKAEITPIDDGKKLKVRGYVGSPFLGRTYIWIRTKCPPTNLRRK